jgi:hypothetical protein
MSLPSEEIRKDDAKGPSRLPVGKFPGSADGFTVALSL